MPFAFPRFRSLHIKQIKLSKAFTISISSSSSHIVTCNCNDVVLAWEEYAVQSFAEEEEGTSSERIYL